jgi:branched-chain amino acid transport system ATP-binding protein
VLRLTEVNTFYGPIQALKNVTLTVAEKEIVSLLGGNACGKSTTMKTILGLVRPKQGRIEFCGRRIDRLPSSDIVRAGIAPVLEARRLFPYLSVHENLLMGAYTRRDADGIRADVERMYALFPVVKDRTRQQASTLSGGEQQMVAVGRGLMAEPEVLMLDELSLGLSPLLALTLFEALTRLKKTGLTMLLVEQNVTMALAVSDYAYVLAEGKVHLEGPARELSKNDEVRRTYLGI